MTRRAIVVGTGLPFGAEIEVRLRSLGFAVESEAKSSAEKIDALIVNVPVELDEVAFDAITDEQFRSAIGHQLYTVVAAAQTAAPRLNEGGSIVHVASRAHLGGWGGAHQMAAGAALIAISRSMALEFADAGVRVNCVAADFIGAPWDTPEARSQVAEIVAFLAGPESRLISGETLLVDETQSLRMTASARRQDIR